MGDVTASIVVPVYNSERYLEECVRSAMAQTCQSVEVVCVDNGSADGSLEILNGLSREDGRVKVLTEPRSGVSYARNTGMAAAQGDYLFFLDADDLMEPACVERAVAKARACDADMTIFSFGEFYASDNVKIGAWPCPEKSLFERAFSVADIEGPVTFVVTPNVWRIAYKTDFVRSIGADYPVDLKSSEDLVFVYQTMFAASRIALMADELYRYRRDSEGSLTRCDRQAAGLRALDAIVERVDEGLWDKQWFQRQFTIMMLDTFEYQLGSAATAQEFRQLYEGYHAKWRTYADEHASMIPERYRFFYEHVSTGDPFDYLFALFSRERDGAEQRNRELCRMRQSLDEAREHAEETRRELDGVYASKSWRLARSAARMLGK